MLNLIATITSAIFGMLVNNFNCNNKLLRCDVVFPVADRLTYYDESLRCGSVIDYILTSNLKDTICHILTAEPCRHVATFAALAMSACRKPISVISYLFFLSPFVHEYYGQKSWLSISKTVVTRCNPLCNLLYNRLFNRLHVYTPPNNILSAACRSGSICGQLERGWSIVGRSWPMVTACLSVCLSVRP